MKISSYVLSSAFLILLSASQCCVAKYSAAELASDYNELRTKFKKSPVAFGSKQQSAEVSACGSKIIGGLTNPENYVNRLATDGEKELIIKTIITDALFFDRSSFGFDRSKIMDSLKKSPYTGNAEILGLTFEIAYELVSQFEEGGYRAVDVRKILQAKMMKKYQNGYQTPMRKYEEIIPSDEFINCFYESLEEHYEKLSFFVGKASKEWFEEVQKQIEKGNVSRLVTTDKPSDKNAGWLEYYHCWVFDDNNRPIAVYKPNKAYGRMFNPLILTSLVAKSIGMSDLVNPKVPVYVHAEPLNDVRFQATGYRGTIEPFLGYSEGDIPKASSAFNDFTDYVLKFALDHPRAQGAYRFKTQEVTFDHFRGSKYYAQQAETSQYFNLDQSWFEQKFVQEFNEDEVKLLANEKTVSKEDAFKILVLKYLMQDFEGLGKILFDVDFANEKLRLVLCGDERGGVPQLYKLAQAGASLDASEMQKILGAISVESLQDVLVAFDVESRKKIQKHFERLKQMKDYCGQSRTIRDVTRELWGSALPDMYLKPLSSSLQLIKKKGDRSRNAPTLDKWIYSFTEEDHKDWSDTLALYPNII